MRWVTLSEYLVIVELEVRPDSAETAKLGRRGRVTVVRARDIRLEKLGMFARVE